MWIKVDIASGWYVNRLAVSVSCVKKDMTVSIVPSHMPIKADHWLSGSHQGESAAGRATLYFVVAGPRSRQSNLLLPVHAAGRATMCFVVAGPCSRQSHHVFCCLSVHQAEPPCVLLLSVYAPGRATMCFVVACPCSRQRATMRFVVACPCSRQRATMRFVVACLWRDWFSPARVFISWRSTSLRAPLASRWSW